MFKAHRYLPAAFALVVLAAMPACASYRGPYGRPGNARVDDRAYRNGYDRGRSEGESDARRGRSFDYGRHDDYRDADDRYRGSGDRGRYREGFRQGFIRGYNDGYRRYARNDSRPPQGRRPVFGQPSRYPVYASPAAEIGYRDGIARGREDARERRRFDPVRAPRYRSGDHDYNSRYGSRDDYKRAYRAAFQQGYEQGYRGYRR
ncbi:MAG: hypothetical protein GEU82_09270 [Luteitalea sp.]|nr:hypothetical protein [Luteitalea sp.]